MSSRYRPAALPFCLCLSAAAAQAAPAAPDSGTLLKELQGAPVLAAPAAPSVERPARPAAPGVDGMAVRVAGWKFSGNTVFSDGELAALLADTIDTQLDLAGLNRAVARITGHYGAAGYPLAQALLPRQRISGGLIEVAIIEGRIEAATLAPGAGATLAPALLADFLGRVPAGQIASDAAINRLALLASELPGMTARVILKPGQQAGATALELQLDQARPWTAGAYADNQGAYATGRGRAGVYGALYNLAGRGDSLELSALGTSGRQTYGALDYSLALSGAGDRLGLGLSHLSYALGGVYAGQGSGSADTLGLQYRYPLVRTPQVSLSLLLKAEARQLRDQNPAFANDRRAALLTLGLSGAAGDKAGATSAYGQLTGGRISFQDGLAGLLDQLPSGPHVKGDFIKLGYGASRQQRLSDAWSLFGGVNGQVAASHRLDSSERMALGGANAVRAYPVGETTGDAGYVASAEVRYAPARLAHSQFMVFYDAGRIVRDANIDPASDGAAKRGYGVGANYLGPRWQLRASLAWRATGRAAADPGAGGQQLYIQFAASY